jgi:GNAT superfamily N-acetyltransferase
MLDDEDDDRTHILAAHAALVAEGTLEPLSTDPAETRLWLDCELASLVENRFFETVDPLTMTSVTRARWEPSATSDEPLSSPHGHDWYRIPYWIREGGERAGTLGLATSYMGIGMVTVSSLYVLPALRGRGVAGGALRRAQAAVRAHGGRCLRVPAYWSWQPAVRFYLGLGMWVGNWKHSLVFAWHQHLPAHRCEIGASRATFGVDRGGRTEPLIVAEREGDRLGWTELPRFAALREEEPQVFHLGRSTFALQLAVHGFPLIRSPEAWERRHDSSDAGDPEGLAYKIEVFEAWDRRSGFALRTPRIPGIAYREWEDID